MAEKLYQVRYLTENAPLSTDEYGALFSIPAELEEAKIDIFSDTPQSYRPYCACRVGWNEKGLYIYEYAMETELRMEGVGTACRAWCDSCLEVFLAADINRPRLYMNYECTPAPYVYLALGESRENRRLYRELPEGMEPKSIILPGVGWSISYCIPIRFLNDAFGISALASGIQMRANFQKCGDETKVPHWAFWNEILPNEMGVLDFHQPRYFGRLILLP